MNIRFSADEIFEVAEKKEQDAAAFYNAAASHVGYPGARQLLEELASWEEKHEQIFAGMRASLTAAEKEETTFDPYDENAQYLRALADHSVYQRNEDPAAIVGKQPTFEDVLNIAIGKEKDTVLFYLGIRELVPEAMGQSRLKDIIEEEKRHVRILTEQLSKTTSSQKQ